MELGALVCTARSPRCDECPVADLCAWNRAGRPAYTGRLGAARPGTARTGRPAAPSSASFAPQPMPVSGADLREVWPADPQRMRCLDSLVADGLVEPLAGDRYRLPA